MANEFFRFFDSMIDRGYFMHLEIGYNKTADYCIHVYRKGMGESGKDLEMVSIQDIDVNMAFARAYVALKEWLLKNNGGY